MEYEQILVDRRDDIVLLTLNRPERLNAWTPRMTAELADAIECADSDRSVGAVVITGAGKGFCAGADVHWFASQIGGGSGSGGGSGGTPLPVRDWIEVLRSTKPIVAAVNGVAVGVGLTMILPVDRIVASDASRFSLRFVKMGLVPELASSRFLPERVGFGAASDLMLSGRMVDAAEAVQLRLADELAPADSLLDVAIERARSYGENPAPQLRWIKMLLTENSCEPDTAAIQQRELKYLAQAYATDEHREAVAAFMEKRPPTFR